MPYAASYSKAPELSDAVDSVCGAVADELNGETPDLSFLFASHTHAERFDELPGMVREKSRSRVLLGCAGESIAGGGEEIEQGPAVSLWSAVMPEARIEPFHVEFEQTADGVILSGLPAGLSDRHHDVRAVFLLGEPFSSAPNSIIDRLADELPQVPLMGGMASGGTGPGENRLFFNSECIMDGAVGAILCGGPRIRSVVSQGCRPIATHFVVTKADQNIVFELGGVPVIQRLKEILPELPERDQRLAQQGLHLGIVMDEYQETFSRGDFLISNVMGADPENGSIAIGNLVRVGQTVQFHVRDADTADEDLVQLLKHDLDAHPNPPQAALLFSCNGRGTRLFSEPNHDAQTIQSNLGPLPLAGFFAQGELGPVGGSNFIHGYTASVACFE